jgi:hypothetical protein
MANFINGALILLRILQVYNLRPGGVLLVRVENSDKPFWKQKFHAANEKAQRGAYFSSFGFLGGGCGRRAFFCFFGIPKVFPSGSQKFPQILNTFPKRSQ